MQVRRISNVRQNVEFQTVFRVLQVGNRALQTMVRLGSMSQGPNMILVLVVSLQRKGIVTGLC
jgi:hypothetical protein